MELYGTWYVSKSADFEELLLVFSTAILYSDNNVIMICSFKKVV